MTNHTEILDDIVSKIDAFERGSGEMEENLWPSAREVFFDLRSILEKGDPPLGGSFNQ